MSKFFVGQRVRVLWAEVSPEAVGREATIASVNERAFCARRNKEWTGYGLRIDGLETHIPGTDKPRYVMEGGKLAPAYDGHQLIAWESCLWQPSPQEANA